MFENFRERLQTVQQDFTTGIKTLSDKSKEVKIKKQQRRGENFSQFTAGVEILRRYEDIWVTLHKGGKECAKAGEVVDGEVVMLTAHWEKQRATLGQLQEQLRYIPAFLADLEGVTASIGNVPALSGFQGELLPAVCVLRDELLPRNINGQYLKGADWQLAIQKVSSR